MSFLIRWVPLTKRGAKLFAKYNQNGNQTDLTKAIDNYQNALLLCPPGNPFRYVSLNLLANALLIQYRHQENLAELTRAIQYHEEALHLCPPGHPDRSASLNNLANTIQTRYEREGNLVDLTRAIQYTQEALDLRPPGDPGRFLSLSGLAVAIQTRYDREGNSADLTSAIQYGEEALDLCPLGHPGRPGSLNTLAYAIQARYRQEGNLDDLSRAIQYYEEVLELHPPGDPDRFGSLNNLADAIQTRYKREGNLVDLTRTIQYHSEALNICPSGHPNRPTSLNNLAIAIQIRYDTEGDLVDLTTAIQYHKEALELRPPGHPDRSNSLSNMADAIQARYNREGSLADLTRTIEYHEEALDLYPPGHPLRSVSLNNLANAIRTRYEREGNLVDLTRAIQYHEEVLDLHPPGHLDRFTSLNNLGIVIGNRYKREGNPVDLARAIQYHEEALDLCPPGHTGRTISLSGLANAMQTRYEAEGNLDDLARAILYHEEGLALHSPGHPDRSTSLNNLAVVIRTRYEVGGDLTDLTRAIQYHEEVLEQRPPGHPYRSDSLLHLATALHAQYSKVENFENSVDTASLGLRADTSGPLKHLDHPSSERSDSRDTARHRIISLLREASQSAGCSPRDCLKSALNWVKISKDLAPESTLEAYTAALDQLDRSLAIAQSLNQRHNRLLSDETLAKAKDLGADAATWALRHNDLERAVELLERGHSLLLVQIGRYRVELDDLRLASPELADRFARLSQLLDASIVSNQKLEDASSTIKDPYERYRKVSSEWTQTVDEIRNLPGFQTFLKPTSHEQLQQAASEGPIIILIPNEEGSTALVIRKDQPTHRIDLPEATPHRLAELSHNFSHALNHKEYSDAQRERECASYLASLWNEVVGPIAQALQYDLAIPLRSRVWWCPSSVACFLPLHAAGLYSKGTARDNFPDKYISSYTPTLQALRRARRPNSTASKRRLLVISQPHTPGEPPLPYARVEADTIANIMSSTGTEPFPTTTSLSSEAGTREAVQSEMRSHPWIHFICHGVQKANEPLESYLSLHDGPLTLREIIEQNLPNADFAFLAACHSAAGDKDLANEALHLAAAMQFAGFRGVVGTLWKMRDVDGPPLAEAFYQDMAKRGDHRRAAVAMSKAINHLRRNKVPIHCWMRFIHIGA